MPDEAQQQTQSTGRRLSIAMIGTRGLPASYGGVEMAVEALSRELVRRGHSVVVYGRSAYCDTSLRERDGVSQIPLPQINTKHLEAISHTVLSTAHAAMRRKYDIIHFHATGPTMLSLATVSLGIPTVATVHGLDWRREKWGIAARRILRAATRVAATVPSATIAVSRELADTLNAEYGCSTTYIPNGVSLDGLSEETSVNGLRANQFILLLGRIVPEKQAHLLIQAFRTVDTHYRLAIVGPSSHSDSYVSEVERLAAQDPRVLLLGARYGPEKAWLLRNAAIFVQPSTLEGLPLALLEALALDRFTVVSDIPGNLEAVTVLDDKIHGLVFRAGDVADLSAKLTLALSRSSTLQRETPPVSQLIHERYDWSNVARETEALYQRALQQRR
jgi:glycosyltransferase involved in cell wall biosynthesis